VCDASAGRERTSKKSSRYGAWNKHFDGRLRARFAAAAADERAAVSRELASAGVAHVALSTDRDWLRDLAIFVRRRRA